MDIDVNQLANSLNAKIDLPQGLNQSQIDYVVDWKAPTAEDPTWYRVYKSGWVEQGGVFVPTVTSSIGTVQLLKKFNNAKYFVWNTSTYSGSDRGNFNGCYDLTTTNFKCGQVANYTCTWYACGKLAEGAN